MEQTELTQKKNKTMAYLYATIIALLVIACGVTIGYVNAKNTTTSNQIGGENEQIVEVSATTFVLPLKDATVVKDYSATELQYNETLKQWEIHKGIDFVVGEDKNVYAISNGTVSNIYTNYLEGTVVEISHKDGLISIYKSLNKDVDVSVGTKVNAGTKIGVVAASMAQELNAGEHLHLEITKNGTKVNPNNYLDLGNK